MKGKDIKVGEEYAARGCSSFYKWRALRVRVLSTGVERSSRTFHGRDVSGTPFTKCDGVLVEVLGADGERIEALGAKGSGAELSQHNGSKALVASIHVTLPWAEYMAAKEAQAAAKEAQAAADAVQLVCARRVQKILAHHCVEVTVNPFKPAVLVKFEDIRKLLLLLATHGLAEGVPQ